MAFLIMSSAVSAGTYYVAPSGGKDSNPGTFAQPWATWQKAFDTAIAGDTVYFRGGTWTGATTAPVLSGKRGTYSNPICFFSYPGEKPIFDCSSYSATGDKIALGIDNSTYIRFRGLTVKNCQQIVANQWISGISVLTCGTLYFDQTVITNTGGYGFWTSGYDTLYLTNCDSYNNADYNGSDPGNRADGFQISSGGQAGDYTVITGCRSWNNSDDGFEVSTGREVYFYNNWAFGNGRYSGGAGIGLKCAPGTDPANKRLFYNNVFAWNKGYGISNNFVDPPGPNATYYNNSIYKSTMGFNDDPGGYDCTSGTAHTYHYNNIVYASTYYGYQAYLQSCEYQPEVGPVYNTESHNTWRKLMSSPYWEINPAFTVTDADFVSLDTTGMSGARGIDGSLPFTNFMKLASTSDLIDAGVDIGFPYNGSAPDLGYSEYLGGSVTPTAPTFISAVVENATPSRLDMTYSLTLANIVPATSAFTVLVNSSIRSVSAVAISGTKVLLTLTSPVGSGDAVTIAYTKPSTNPLQTAAGGQAASFTAQNVTNNVAATVIPGYLSSVVENATPSRLDITYNLTLANIVPATSAFTVLVNSSIRPVSAVAISGTKVLLTLTSPVGSGDAVTFAYTKPSTNPLQTAAGGQAASFTAQNVTNNVAATVIPGYLSSVVENATPSRLDITYNLTLANIVPATSAFTVLVNSSIRSVTAIAISGTKVLLTLASPVGSGDAVTVAYTKPSTNPLQTAAGGQAASFTAQNVTNNVAATVIPGYLSSVVENATPSRLDITYNLTLANIVPATSAFTVLVNSSIRPVTAIAISGTKVLLTLASPVGSGDAVTVAYTKPSTNPLQTAAGGQAASISAQNVTNNVVSCNPRVS